MMLQPVVEGYGEVEAVPILLRRLVNLAELWGRVRIGQAIRIPRDQLVKQSGLNRASKLARKNRASAILVLLASDSDCPAELGPRLQQISDDLVGDIPCRVVMADHVLEEWFLAAIT